MDLEQTAFPLVNSIIFKNKRTEIFTNENFKNYWCPKNIKNILKEYFAPQNKNEFDKLWLRRSFWKVAVFGLRIAERYELEIQQICLLIFSWCQIGRQIRIHGNAWYRVCRLSLGRLVCQCDCSASLAQESDSWATVRSWRCSASRIVVKKFQIFFLDIKIPNL